MDKYIYSQTFHDNNNLAIFRQKNFEFFFRIKIFLFKILFLKKKLCYFYIYSSFYLKRIAYNIRFLKTFFRSKFPFKNSKLNKK